MAGQWWEDAPVERPAAPPRPVNRSNQAAQTLGGAAPAQPTVMPPRAPQAAAKAAEDWWSAAPEVKQGGASEPAPYKDKTQALDDAVNYLEEGRDIAEVEQAFAGAGITRQEIMQHGQQRGGQLFQPEPPGPKGAVPAQYGLAAASDRMQAVELNPVEDYFVNTAVRGIQSARKIADAISMEIGLLNKEDFARRTAASNKAIGAAMPTERVQAGLEEIGNAKTLGEGVAAVATNPVASLVTLAESMISSSPVIAASVLGSAAGPLGTGAAGYAASFAQEYGSAIADAVQEAGLNPNSQADIEKVINDPELMAKAREKGVKRGLVVGAFDALSAGVAGRFLGSAERAAKAATKAGVSGGAKASKGLAAIKEASVQGGFAGAGEAGAEAWTGEYKPGEIVLEALGDAPQSAVEVATGLRADRKRATGLAAAKMDAKPTAGTQASAGAAGTDAETVRRQRAASLPVPVELTKGQATREGKQQQFEKQQLQDADVGKELRDMTAEQTNRILKNFDVLEEQTGATKVGNEDVGEAVVGPIEQRVAAAKEKIRAAYKAAEDAGETAERVSPGALVRYLNDESSSAINAPIIKSAGDRLVELGGAERDANGKLVPGEISLSDLEKIRQSISKDAGEPGTPNNFRAGELKTAIDAVTEGKGGELYKGARKLYAEYAGEFKNQALIRDLISNKRGTSDRKIALEEVYNKTVKNGSVENLRRLQDTLVGAGEVGQQALRELRGAAVRDIREQATRTTSVDERGQKVPSVAGLNNAVKALDKNGKLELLFGKQGAQTFRDLGDLASDIYTAPPGLVNTSGTAAAIAKLTADWAASTAITGIPAPLLSIAKSLKQWRSGRKTKAQIAEALKQPEGLISPDAKPDLTARPFDAASVAREKPEPILRKPGDPLTPRTPETARVIELRKQKSVLEKLRECLET